MMAEQRNTGRRAFGDVLLDVRDLHAAYGAIAAL